MDFFQTGHNQSPEYELGHLMFIITKVNIMNDGKEKQGVVAKLRWHCLQHIKWVFEKTKLQLKVELLTRSKIKKNQSLKPNFPRKCNFLCMLLISRPGTLSNFPIALVTTTMRAPTIHIESVLRSHSYHCLYQLGPLNDMRIYTLLNKLYS